MGARSLEARYSESAAWDLPRRTAISTSADEGFNPIPSIGSDLFFTSTSLAYFNTVCDGLLAKWLRASSVNRISNALRAALNLAAAQDQRIHNQSAWRIGLASIFDAAQARNVILSDQVIRDIITAAFDIGGELGLLVETAAVTGARVSQIANLCTAARF
ncbi:MAG TPA: hypothetical protein VEH02_05035 [Pseudolabrys sp.]|nr:hypothetical protein [Pseudolabrys sp.]